MAFFRNFYKFLCCAFFALAVLFAPNNNSYAGGIDGCECSGTLTDIFIMNPKKVSDERYWWGEVSDAMNDGDAIGHSFHIGGSIGSGNYVPIIDSDIFDLMHNVGLKGGLKCYVSVPDDFVRYCQSLGYSNANKNCFPNEVSNPSGLRYDPRMGPYAFYIGFDAKGDKVLLDAAGIKKANINAALADYVSRGNADFLWTNALRPANDNNSTCLSKQNVNPMRLFCVPTDPYLIHAPIEHAVDKYTNNDMLPITVRGEPLFSNLYYNNTVNYNGTGSALDGYALAFQTKSEPVSLSPAVYFHDFLIQPTYHIEYSRNNLIYQIYNTGDYQAPNYWNDVTITDNLYDAITPFNNSNFNQDLIAHLSNIGNTYEPFDIKSEETAINHAMGTIGEACMTGDCLTSIQLIDFYANQPCITSNGATDFHCYAFYPDNGKGVQASDLHLTMKLNSEVIQDTNCSGYGAQYGNTTQQFNVSVQKTDRLDFIISAAGTFNVNCIGGGTLSGPNVSGNTIYRSATFTEDTYRCSWPSNGSYTVSFTGVPEAYNDEYKAAIRFNLSRTSGDPNALKLTGITGSLGAVFSTVSKPPKGIEQPSFENTFASASEMVGSIPSGLFTGITGQPIPKMFFRTFIECGKLTGSIPSDLFSGLSGTPTDQLFQETFRDCVNLTGNITNTMFGNLSGSVATSTFTGTFARCVGVSGVKIGSANATSYVPSTFLSSITAGNDTSPDMLYSTGIGNCPAGKYNNVPSAFADAAKPWCASCPSVYPKSAANNTATIANACYATVTFNSNGGSSVSSQNKYYASNAQSGYTITPPTSTKTGYTLNGWYQNSNLSGSAVTSSTTLSGNKTLYAKWNTCTYSHATAAAGTSSTCGGTCESGYGNLTCNASGCSCTPLAEFTVTTSATNTFSFMMSAAGTFYVDCGTGGTLSSTANDITNGNTITRSDTTTQPTYTCSYSDSAVRTINFSGDATGYTTTTTSYGAPFSAIRFNLGGDNGMWGTCTNAPKITGISGSLGAIFGTVSNPPSGQASQPRFHHTFAHSHITSIPSGLFTGISGAPIDNMFYGTFANCSYLTDTNIDDPNNPGKKYALPPTLFSGISGQPARSVFSQTFYGCNGLTGTIPATLFSGISGTPASSMFSFTFSDCSGLTGTIPATLFSGISGTPASSMFSGTFKNCSGLTGKIPTTLFSGISGTPASNMFSYTFWNCGGLTGFTDGTTDTTYVPGNFLENITTNTSVSNQATSMFANTGLASTCPTGMYNSTRTQFNNASKPWCSAAEQYTIAFDMNGGTARSSISTIYGSSADTGLQNIPTRSDGWTFTHWDVSGMTPGIQHQYSPNNSTWSNWNTSATAFISSNNSSSYRYVRNLRTTSGTVTFKAQWSQHCSQGTYWNGTQCTSSCGVGYYCPGVWVFTYNDITQPDGRYSCASGFTSGTNARSAGECYQSGTTTCATAFPVAADANSSGVLYANNGTVSCKRYQDYDEDDGEYEGGPSSCIPDAGVCEVVGMNCNTGYTSTATASALQSQNYNTDYSDYVEFEPNGEIESSRDPYRAGKANGEWDVWFNYGVVRGMSRCSYDDGDVGDTASSVSNDGGNYCWCKTTGFNASGNNQSTWLPAVSSEWYLASSMSDDAEYCAYECSYVCSDGTIGNDSSMRSDIYDMSQTYYCNANTYTVAFNSNSPTSGSPSAASVSCTYGQNCPAFATQGTMVKTGYTFAGWNTANDGTGTNYAAGATPSNLSSTNGATVTLYAKWEPVEFTVTTSATNEFKFKMSAAGTFYVDCGTGGTLSSTANDITNGNTITRSDTTTQTTYTCSYSDSAVRTINFSGDATGYSKTAESSIYYLAAIRFNLENSSNSTCTNAPKLTGISGSLGAIFGTVSNPPSEQASQPRFTNTFAYSHITSIPSGLFTGISGTPISNMFYRTFAGCSSLTSTNIDDPNNSGMKYALPPTLFSGISGQPAANMFEATFMNSSLTGSLPSGLFGSFSGTPRAYMFSQTFYGCSGLTGSLPSGLFGSFSGEPAFAMFGATFEGCSGLTGKIPFGLFGNFYGTPIPNMFRRTFYGCSGLTGFTDGTIDTTYVPGNFLQNISTNTGPTQQAKEMFVGTGLASTCPTGMYDSTRTQFNDAGKPWCSTSTYTVAFNSNSPTSGSPSAASVSCTYGQNCPAFATQGTMVKTGYIFAGWNTASDGTGTNYAAGATPSNLSSTNGATVTLYAQWEPVEFTVTTSATNEFKFMMSAAGTFYVDCGTGGTLSSTANDITNGNTITRSDTTTQTTYTCSYSDSAVRTINFAGDATGYSTTAESYIYYLAAIRFNLANTNCTNAPKLTGISGSLGAIFGTVSNPPSGQASQPRFTNTFAYSHITSIPSGLFTGISGTPISNMFYKTFSNCSYLTNTNIDDPNNPGKKYALPPTLFSGISGTPASNMFNGTFSSCSGLTGTIPATLFSGISGQPAQSMFNNTFSDCSGLTGTIPATLFSGISGTPASYMFGGTFLGCSGLTGTIPATLFSGISGTPASNMFSYTFWHCGGLTGKIPTTLFSGISGTPASNMFNGTFFGCSNLTGFTDGTTNTTYVPGNFLENITTNTSVSGQATSMFALTGLVSACPTGTYDSTRTQFNNASKPWCSTSTYTVAFNSNSPTSGSPSVASVSCTYGENCPAFATQGTMVKTGYTFAGWNTASDGTGTNYAAGATPSNLTGTNGATVTLYAKWTANTYTVTLNGNSGSGGTASVTATYDAAMPTPITLPTRTGYTFAGYYDTNASTGGTQYYTNAGASAKNWDKTSATPLYARWSTCSYTNATAAAGTASTCGGTCNAGYSNKTCDGSGCTCTPGSGTAYKVYHYTKNANGINYTQNGSVDNLTGTTGATLTLANLVRSITGFTYDRGFAGTSAQGTTMPSSGAVIQTTILADGTRVISLYYNRNTYTINYTLNGGSIVPAGYTPVEYIQTSGSSYINTGVLINTTTSRYETKINPTTTSGTNGVFGARNVAGTAGNASANIFLINGNWRIDWAAGTTSTVAATANTDYTFNITRGLAFVNGTPYTFSNNTSVNINYPFYIGVFNEVGSPYSNSFKGKIYYGKLYNNNVLAFNGIPVRRTSDNICGMYDTVTGTFFRSATSTNFTCPETAVTATLSPDSYTYGVGATANGIPSRANSTFGGWCTDSALTNCSNTQTISTTDIDNKTFYAKWTCNTGYTANSGNTACDANVYTMTLNTNCPVTGGTTNQTVYQKYATGWSTTNFGTTITKVTVPTCPGYTFRGFYTTQLDALTSDGNTGTQKFAADGTINAGNTNTSNTIYYGAWAKNCTTPSNGTCNLSVTNAGAVDYTTSCSTGYTISGNNSATPSCNANTNTITLNKHGGSGTIKNNAGTTYTGETAGSMTCSTGATGVSLPTWASAASANNTTNITKTDYKFLGWSTDSSCTTSSCATTSITCPSANTTYYAVWQSKTDACTACNAGANCTCSLSISNNTCTYTTGAASCYYVSSGANTATPACTIYSPTITAVAGNGISKLTASGWTGTGSATLTKQYNCGSTITLSTLAPTQKTCYSGVNYTKTSGSTGSISNGVFTVGTGAATITATATTLTPPTNLGSNITKTYNESDTTFSNSGSCDTGVTLTYKFGSSTDNSTYTYADSFSSTNSYTVSKTSHHGTKYYKVQVKAHDGVLSDATATSSAKSVTLTQRTITFNATSCGSVSGTSPLYARYNTAALYTGANSDTTGTVPTATQTHATFAGWYTAATGGTQVYNASKTLQASVSGHTNASSQWIPTENKTLYAQYNCATGYSKDANGCCTVAGTSTVTLDKNASDATAGTTSVTPTYDAAMPTPITLPTRVGYTFAGYYDTNAATGGNKYYNADGTSARTWNKTGAQTLYARWSTCSYTNATAAAGTASTCGGTCNAGYSNKTCDGSGCTCTPGIYTVTLDSKYYSSSDASSGTAVDTASSPTPIYVKYNTGWYSNSGATTSVSSVSVPVYSSGATKYVFGGFYTGKAGTGTQIINASGAIVSGKTTFTTSNTTLYAKWTAATCSVTNGTATISINNNTPTCAVSCASGYSQNGYRNTTTTFNVTGTAGNATVSATCYARTYKVTLDPKMYSSASDSTGTSATSAGTAAYWYVFNSNTPSYFYNIEVASASDQVAANKLGSNGYTIVKPTLTGYTFGGYYTGKTGTGTQYMTANGTGTNNLWSSTGTYGRQDITLCAKWTASGYTVTYAAGTGGTGSITAGNATYNSDFTPATPSSSTIKKDNATFVNWSVSGTSDTKAAGTAFKWLYTENKTFTANWNCNAGYTLDTTSSSSTYNQCVKCAAGYYKASAGNGACTAASQGYYVASTGQTSQTKCAIGTYQDQTGQASCKVADAGYYVASTGANAQTQCPSETGLAITEDMIEQNGITDANGTGTGLMANRVRIKVDHMIHLNPGTYVITYGNNTSGVTARGFYTYTTAGDESSAVKTNGSVITGSATTLTLTEARYVRIVFQKSDNSASITPAEVIAAEPILTKTSAYTTSGTTAADHDNINDCKITCPAGTYVATAGGSCTPAANGYYAAGGIVAYGSTSTRSQCPTNWTSAAGASTQTDCFRTVRLNKNGGNGTIQGTTGTTTPASKTCYYNTSCDFGSAAGLTQDGYTFKAGWETGTSGTCSAITTSFTITSTDTNVDYHACKTVNTNTITLNGNGATGGKIKNTAMTSGAVTFTCTTDSSMSLPTWSATDSTTTTSLVKTDRTFLGWATSSTATSAETITTCPTGNTTYYAVWSSTCTAASKGSNVASATYNGVVNNQCKYTHVCSNGYYNTNHNVQTTSSSISCSNACTNKPASNSHYTSGATTATACSWLCDGGYYTSASNTCSAVGTGYYSSNNENDRHACTDWRANTTTTGTTSTSTSNCLCKAGMYLNSSTCTDAGNGYYSAISNDRTECPTGYSGSDNGRDTKGDCYYTCPSKSVPNASSVSIDTAKVYHNGTSYPTCTYTATCSTGYTASGNGTANPSCGANTNTITLNGNGATGGKIKNTAMTSGAVTFTCTTDSSMSLPTWSATDSTSTTSLVKTDYKFLGWATSSTATSAETITTCPSSNTTYYAVWQSKSNACTACNAGTGCTCSLSIENNQCKYTTGANTGYTLTSGANTSAPQCTANNYTISYTLNGGSIVPSGYTPVEYITSSGGSTPNYFDTSIIFDYSKNFRVVGQFNNPNASVRKVLLGNYSGNAVFNVELKADGKFRTYFNPGTVVDTASSAAMPANTMVAYDVAYTASSHSYTATANGATYTGSVISSSATATNPLRFFLDFRSGPSAIAYPVSMGVTTIYKNNEMVGNFIPVRQNSDNVCGMYDTVTGTFFKSANSTAFTCPNTSTLPSSYTYGVGANIKSTPTKTGYTFAGWTGSNGTTAQTSVTISTTDSGNKSYTANWTACTYTNATAAAGSSGICGGTCNAGYYNLSCTGTGCSCSAIQVTTPTNHLTYSGSAQTCPGITVTAPSSGNTIKYGTDGSTYSSNTPRTITNAGNLSVYYKVTTSDGSTKTGSYTCYMDKKSCGLTLKTASNGTEISSGSSGSTNYPNNKTIYAVTDSACTLAATSSATGTATVSVPTSSSSGTVTMTPAAYNATAATITVTGTKPNDNYESVSKTYNLTVSKGTMSASASGNTQTYAPNTTLTCDGGTWTGVPSGSTTTYSTTNGSGYGSTKPTRTNAGTTTVYYKITNPNYNDFTGSFSCTVNKANGTTTFKDGTTTVTSGSTAFNGTKSLTVVCSESGTLSNNSVTSGSTSVATVANTGNNVTLTPVATGNSVITANCPATTNYKASSGTYTWTVSNGTITHSSSTKKLAYTGNAQSCANVTASAPSSTATITYSTSQNGTYSSTAPKLTNGGSQTVYYKVTAPNYTDASGSYLCTMAQITLSATSGSTNYPNTKTFTASTNNGGTLSVSPTSGDVVATAAISNGTVTMTPKKTGTQTITISSTANGNYAAVSTTYTLTVNTGNYEITLDNASATTNGTSKIYTTYKTNVYLDSGRTTVMTTTNNPITTPAKTGTCATVTYSLNGGTLTPTTATPGYEFKGYLTHSGGSTLGIEANGKINDYGLASGKDMTKNETWNAQWQCAEITLPTPTKTGHNFTGWYDAATGGNKIGNAGAKYRPTANKIIYAQWTVNDYNITYNLNGGIVVPSGYTPVEYITGTGAQYIDTNIVPQGNEVFNIDFTPKTDPSSFTILFGTRVGATVEGPQNAWLGYNSSMLYVRFGTRVPSSTTTITKNTHYRATVDLPGTKVTLNDNIYPFTGAVVSGITRSIYFAGMNTDASLGNVGTVDYRAFSIVRNGTALFNGIPARRNSDNVCGLYDTVSGTFFKSTSSTNFTCPSASALPSSYTYGVGANISGVPTRANSKFTGWTGSNGSTPQTTVVISTTDTGNKSYSANWTCDTGYTANSDNTACNANTYTVVYNSNKPSTATASIGGTTANSSHTYDVAKALTTNGYTLTGWTFAGWATSASGDVVYSNGQSVTNLTTTNNGTVNLYAKWTAKTSAVTLNGNNGTIPSGGTTSVTATYDSNMPAIATDKLPTRTGYTFAGYHDTSAATGGTQYYTNAGASARKWNKTDASITLYARWDTCTYTNATAAAGTSSTCGGTCTSGYGNKTCNGTGCTCTANSYTVTLNKNTSSTDSTTVDTVSATFAAAMPLKNTSNANLTIPTNGNNKIINGYYDDRTNGTKYYNISGTTITSAKNWDKTSATTLYAHWTTCTACAAGTGANCTLSVVNNVCTYATSCKDGYHGLTNSGAYNPQCTANTYTVTYNANATGATGSMSDSDHTYDTPKALTTNGFTNGTKKFLGWSTSTTATSATYTNGQSVSNLTTTNGGTVNLYAVWTDCTACSATNANCTLTAPVGVCTYTTNCKTGYGNLQNNGAYNASCTPNVYTVTLDSKYYSSSDASSGTAVDTASSPTPIYVKYNTGWYSNSGATTSVSSVSVPVYSSGATKYVFGGFYTGKAGTGTQIINASGAIVSGKTTFTTSNTTLYAKWTACAACNPGTGCTCSLSISNNACTYTTGTTTTGYTLTSGANTSAPQCTVNTYNISYVLNGADGYTPVEYIQTAGNSYINTGIKGNMGYTYDLDFQQTSANNYRIWGVFNQSGFQGPNMSLTYGSGLIVRWETVANQTRQVSLASIDTNRHKLHIANGHVYYDNVDKGTSAGHNSSFVFNYNLYLGTINPGGTTPSANAKAKIYSYSVKDVNNILIQNLVPVRRNSDNVCGMYDTISGTFFKSITSTDFTCPESTNTMPTSYTYGIGATIDNIPLKTGYSFEGWCTDSTLNTCANIQTISTTDTGNKTFYAKWAINTYTITYNNMNGATNFAGAPSSYNIETNTITLGTPTKTGNTFGGWYDNANFVGTAVTQIAQGSTGNKVFYAKWTPNTYNITYNLNGGSIIPSQYTPVSYIQTSGSSYIDTGIKGNMGYTYDLDFQQTTATTYRVWGVFNQSGYEGPNMSLTYGGSTWLIRWETVSGQIRAISLPTIDTNRHKLHIDDGHVYFDNANKGISEGHNSSFVFNYNLYLGTINPGDTTPSANAQAKIYAYSVKDTNNTLVQNLVPVRRKSDNVCGMYDTVTDTFFKSVTSTDFSCPEAAVAVTPSPVSYTYGIGATIDATPFKAGYSFAGWCTDSALTSCANTQTISPSVTGNKTFYAKWAMCAANTYSKNNQCTACPTGTYSPAGSWKATQCGHILHIGANQVYLHATKDTTPSLNILREGTMWYANMVETPTYMSADNEHYLKIKYNNKLYHVCDDTMCAQ